MKIKTYERIAALAHYALGTERIKVIFRKNGRKGNHNDEIAYWMRPKTYAAISIQAVAFIEDYKKIGELVEAKTVDIYNLDIE